jgi:predicted transcriptional regulator
VPVRTVRVPDELWEAAKRVAADNDETVTDVIIRALERYVRLHPLDED